MHTLLTILIASTLAAPEVLKTTYRFEQAAHNHLVAGSSPAERTITSSWWWIRATVTGYSPHDAIDSGHASTQDTKTATMRDWRTHPYGIAADPRILPYGTYIQVPGYLEKSEPNTAWMVDDTGGRMRQSWRRGIVHIDVRFKTEASARKFGRKTVDILVDTSEMTAAQKRRLAPYKTGEL